MIKKGWHAISRKGTILSACYTNFISWASLVAQTLKNLPPMWIAFFSFVSLSAFLIWWLTMMFFSLPFLFVSYLCSRFRFYGYHEVCMCVLSCSVMSDSVTPRTVACWAPLSMGLIQARILEWVACPSPGDLPNPVTEARSPTLQADSLLSKTLAEPKKRSLCNIEVILSLFCW